MAGRAIAPTTSGGKQHEASGRQRRGGVIINTPTSELSDFNTLSGAQAPSIMVATMGLLAPGASRCQFQECRPVVHGVGATGLAGAFLGIRSLLHRVEMERRSALQP